MARDIDEVWIQQALDNYRRIEQLRERFREAVGSACVTVESADGRVRVVVTAEGEIRDLRVVDPALPDRLAAELSASLRDACAKARDGAAWARQRLHEETFRGLVPPEKVG